MDADAKGHYCFETLLRSGQVHRDDINRKRSASVQNGTAARTFGGRGRSRVESVVALFTTLLYHTIVCSSTPGGR